MRFEVFRLPLPQDAHELAGDAKKLVATVLREGLSAP
jgi:hypothetical protein